MTKDTRTTFEVHKHLETKQLESLLTTKPQNMEAISISYEAICNEGNLITLETQEDIIKTYLLDKNLEVSFYYKISGYEDDAKAKFNTIINHLSKQNEKIAIVFYNIRGLHRIPEVCKELLKLCIAGKIDLYFAVENLVISQSSEFKDIFHFMVSSGCLSEHHKDDDSLNFLSNYVLRHQIKGIKV